VKTTLDLPDDQLFGAKAVTACRRTTLKAMVENLLGRQMAPAVEPEADGPFERNVLGTLVLKPRGCGITLGCLDAIRGALDREELNRARKPGGAAKRLGLAGISLTVLDKLRQGW
jgi:hypothetical protein